MTVLNILFPPQCLACNAQVAGHGTLCLNCWQHIRFITEPFCACCGLPFEYALGDGAICGECMREHPPFSRARAVFRYDEHSRPLVTKLKYADQAELAKTYGNWLNNAGRELVAASDVIVPVPLHYWRFLKRRYNQAALLGKALSAQSKLPMIPDALIRTRHTQPQPGLTRKQRQDNVKGAFAVPEKQAKHIRGKSVLLIDDVMTTSATLSACSKALLQAGALQVYALTLAKKGE